VFVVYPAPFANWLLLVITFAPAAIPFSLLNKAVVKFFSVLPLSPTLYVVFVEVIVNVSPDLVTVVAPAPLTVKVLPLLIVEVPPVPLHPIKNA